MKKFTEFNLHPDLQKGIDSAGFVTCTPVQEETFAAVFSGRDVTVKSQTGTGKTAAFLISLFQTLLEERQAKDVHREMNGEQNNYEDHTDSSLGGSHSGEQVLVLAPTRELVVQIEEEAKVLGEFLEFKFASVYGGVGYNKQEAELAANPDFIFATPGRLMDFTQSRKIDTRRFGYLVIDEADRMFDMGFYPDIQKILRGMKPPLERRTLLFSATLGTRVLNIAWDHMNDPVDIEIEPEHITVDAIDQTLYHVSREEKMSLLLGLIKANKPESALFFTNTKRMAEELSHRLRANNFTAEFIMGDLPQKKRLKIINAVKNKEIRFLVATDVAARGLHIDDLQMVFNYDLPEDSENYVHRIGRTARAGASGKAVSLADEHSVYNLSSIESYLGMKIPVESVSDDLLAEDLSRGMRFHSEYSRGGRSDYGRGGASRGGSSRSGSRSGRSSGSHRSSGRDDNRSKSGSYSDDRNRERDGDRYRKSSSSRQHSQDSNRNRSKNQQQGGGNQRRQSQDRPAKPISKMTEQERLAYYADKYGEEFNGKKSGGSRKSNRRGSGSGEKAGSKSSGGNRNQNRSTNKDGRSGSGASRGGNKGPSKSGSRSDSNSGRGGDSRNRRNDQRNSSQKNRQNDQNTSRNSRSGSQNSSGAKKQPQARGGKPAQAENKSGKGVGGFFKRLFGGE